MELFHLGTSKVCPCQARKWQSGRGETLSWIAFWREGLGLGGCDGGGLCGGGLGCTLGVRGARCSGQQEIAKTRGYVMIVNRAMELN